MGFIHHVAALLALYMNGLLAVLSCVNESSRNATLGESVLLNPDYTDCEGCSVEWIFSSNSVTLHISSYSKRSESTFATTFNAFKHRVNIERDGFYLRLPSVQFNDTGKYTRIFTALNGTETCVSIVIHIYAVSIIGAIFGVIMLVLILWIVRKLTGKASSSENRRSLPTEITTYPIYGNWKSRRGI
ncbi:V-set and transmembrane domain-containing protein 5-like isoform X2 [Heterodontus francisci]|uniref:V-set and transmembrane domain-containing protein 5-like isoform X2 n=1 Tax=Heterodontus francisci TaxID=7792 RepID=UPI00355C6DB3